METDTKFKNPSHVKMCEQCPWRRSNHGKRTPGGFYTKKNLTRLWNQIRRGGGAQTCHLTDPSHPEHVAAGAPLTATPHECAGSLALVLREVEKLNALAESGGDLDDYFKDNRKGLTREGAFHWAMARHQLVGIPMGGHPLPTIDAELVTDLELVGLYD